MSAAAAPSAPPTTGAPIAPPPPARETCPLCGTPLQPEQEWCLGCGAAARTRLAASPNWKTPLVVLAVVATLSLGVIAAALVKLVGGSASSKPATTMTVTTAPSASVPTATSSTPTSTLPSSTLPTSSTPTSSTPAPGALPGGATAPSGTSTSTPGTSSGKGVLGSKRFRSLSPAAKKQILELAGVTPLKRGK